MAIDFPNSPTNGDTFTVGTKTWLFDGTAWSVITGAAILESGSVESDKLANSAVITSKINNGAVTNDKLANSSVTIGSTAVALGATQTSFSGLTSVTSTTASVSGTLTLKTVIESALISATAATGTINIDFLTNPTVYYTTNATANFTLNIRGSSGASMDSVMATGDIATVTFLNTNGATPYRPTVFQVDGSAVTPKWQGGTAPAAGNASSIDGYTFTVVKTASATFTVFASQTRFA
jgi:hypothetical protein